MLISMTTCCGNMRLFWLGARLGFFEKVKFGFIDQKKILFWFEGTVNSPVGVLIGGTTAVCPVWHCTGPGTCSGKTGWGAPQRGRPAAQWSQPFLACWRSLSVCWNHLSCQSGNRTITNLQINSRITFLILDLPSCCLSGQLWRSYLPPAAIAEIIQNGIAALALHTLLLGVAWLWRGIVGKNQRECQGAVSWQNTAFTFKYNV